MEHGITLDMMLTPTMASDKGLTRLSAPDLPSHTFLTYSEVVSGHVHYYQTFNHLVVNITSLRPIASKVAKMPLTRK